MKKQFKYKLRRLIFAYIPFITLWTSIFILAAVRAGIYVVG